MSIVTVSAHPHPGARRSLPDLLPEERSRALADAIAARRHRAATKQGLKRGGLDLEDVIASAADDPAIARLRVLELVESMPGVGPATAGRIVDELGIARSRRVRGLGGHQRRALVERFERS